MSGKTKAPAKKASPKAKAAKPAKKPEPSKNGKLSAIGRCGQGAGRIEGAHEHARDDRGDGQEGLLDQPWRRNSLRFIQRS